MDPRTLAYFKLLMMGQHDILQAIAKLAAASNGDQVKLAEITNHVNSSAAKLKAAVDAANKHP